MKSGPEDGALRVIEKATLGQTLGGLCGEGLAKSDATDHRFAEPGVTSEEA